MPLLLLLLEQVCTLRMVSSSLLNLTPMGQPSCCPFCPFLLLGRDFRQQLGTGEGGIPDVADILDAPPGGEYGLGHGPVAYSCAVKAKLLGQLIHAALEYTARLWEL